MVWKLHANATATPKEQNKAFVFSLFYVPMFCHHHCCFHTTAILQVWIHSFHAFNKWLICLVGCQLVWMTLFSFLPCSLKAHPDWLICGVCHCQWFPACIPFNRGQVADWSSRIVADRMQCIHGFSHPKVLFPSYSVLYQRLPSFLHLFFRHHPIEVTSAKASLFREQVLKWHFDKAIGI